MPHRTAALLALATLAAPAAAHQGTTPTDPVVELERDLAALELSARVDGAAVDVEAALGRVLERARIRAVKEHGAAGAEAARTALALVHLARVRFLVQQGRGAEALAVLAELERAAEDSSEGPASALAAAAREALASDRVADLARAARRLAPQEERPDEGQGTPPRPEDDLIDRMIREAMIEGNTPFVREFGARAVPTLSSLVFEASDVLVESWLKGQGPDPLVILFDLDPERAAADAQRILEAGTFVGTKRVLRAIDVSDVLERQSSWTPVEGGYESRYPGVARVLERVLADGVVPPADVAWALRYYLQRGADEPALLAAFEAWVESLSSTPQILTSALGAERFTLPRQARFLEGLLDAPADDVRAYAAERLVFVPTNEALLARADDISPEVRRSVARALALRDVHVPTGTGQGTWHTRDEVPTVDAARRQVLLRLLRDPDLEVRRAAADALSGHEGARSTAVLDAADYAVLAGEPDDDLRAYYARILAHVEGEGCWVLFRALADDSAREVVQGLAGFVLSDRWWGEAPERWPAIAELFAAPALSAASRDHLQRGVGRACAAVPALRPAVVDWAVEHATRGDWQGILVESDTPHRDRADWVAELAAPDLASTVLAAAPLLETMFDDLPVEPGLADAAETWRIVLATPDAPPAARLVAACGRVAAGDVDEATLAALVETCAAAPQWCAKEESRADRTPWVLSDVASTVRQAMRAAPGNASSVTSALVRDLRVPNALLAMIGERPERGAYDEQTARAILDAVRSRWSPDDATISPNEQQIVAAAVELLLDHPSLVDVEWVGAWARDFRLAVRTLSVVRRLRDRRFLPLLRDIVLDPAAEPGWSEAVDAVTGFLDDDAAELLIEAAGRSTDAVRRERLLAKLDQILAYQEARARWDRRRASTATREAAIAELLTLLDHADEAVRVEAIRGLATLDAVGAMPRLIRFVAEGSDAERAAARTALDRLNGEGD